MQKYNFITVLFGPIGDTLMAIALWDDVQATAPGSTLLILTRQNPRLIADLAKSYPSITVRQIPSNFKALPFFIRILCKQWTLLTLGVTGAYSVRLKLFFFALSRLPGNRSAGFNDQAPDHAGWLPLQTVLQFDGSKYIIDNFRMLLPCVLGKGAADALYGKPPHVQLSTQKPEVEIAEGKYIVVHLFGASIRRSLPTRRWIALLQEIEKEYPDIQLVLTGNGKDEIEIKEVVASVPNAIAAVNLPILVVAWLIEHAALYIGVDTGITHLAGVLQQKSIIISHFGDPTWIPTYNPNTRALVNSAHGKYAFVEEGGIRYSCAMYDISDRFFLDSVRLALDSPQRSIPLFAGFKDEHCRERDAENND